MNAAEQELELRRFVQQVQEAQADLVRPMEKFISDMAKTKGRREGWSDAKTRSYEEALASPGLKWLSLDLDNPKEVEDFLEEIRRAFRERGLGGTVGI